MSFGKMNTFLSIVEKQFTQDEDGFKTETDVTVAEVRAYREGRHGSEKYTAAGDSKHPVTVEEHKSARLLFEFQEMQEGGDRF